VFDEEIPFPEIADLVREQREADRRFLAFAQGLRTEADLDAEVRLERVGHVQVERVEDVVLHLAVHQIHHRGQVHAMLSGTSVKPPQLDEFFMREELPLRREELAELGLPLV
jgi:uncharacterized damage-inducible protein DinB